MSFKSLLTDPSNLLSSWKGDNCCNWNGIKCSSSGHVVFFNLQNPHPDEVIINANKEVVSSSNNESDFALKGTLSPLLFTIDHIQYLDLSFSNFVFSKLLAEISNVTNFTYLNLSNSMFQDSITTQFSNLTSLRSLDLSCAILVPDLSSITVSLTLPPKLDSRSLLSFISYGYLSSPNLRWLEGLRNLRYLVMTERILIDQLLNLTSLSVLDIRADILSYGQTYLDISVTQVGGTVPSSLRNSTTLTVFLADGCLIQGSIPSSITKLKKLRLLMLNDNNITGQLPPEILEFTSYNMRGEIQKFFSNLTSLVVLLLENNSLSGAIPYWMFNLPYLSVLDLSMNNFEGVIPPSIQMKSSLFPSIVNLARNKLEGPIPTQLENVNVIDLSLNNFVGSIPAQIGEIPAIRSISLSKNKIHGSIPESFCQSTNVLQVLDLSNNNLSGPIPHSLGNCKSLIYLSLGQKKLTGSVPEELERITSLRYLDLNGNEFKGSFPTVIEKFQELEILNLASNRFKGRIPKFIGDLLIKELQG
ncbi:hypothetical protein CQW23_16420 [Capsicum baccatum]|uniref:Leucine-rich repeat-containing N-terminal plant-type domain-containing protein n=1 Tax=Capsicum baccatum TaxID=33114 RepID=A0A2G2WAW9_CAPBA|nr:hypothetical protein CQW23_16420 [Capsicum baccatum]